ncbi:patatin-like protein [Tenggerimyces flavus]|uniref:Patatin-like protein n=1 Tax=Tenggerimyces flavus TaxID=1708749 RepID=A0ABV7YNE8_9ACTN|nr:patatin-like protein [Tenggerimyces flavus]MBM7786308.1 patatin-related protein [Tenggerimyces flavus]
MSDRPVEPSLPVEEIRLAVVLNGGVSLAIWMGGATLEIDRLTRREGPYAALLDLMGSEARADVITGSSAGGINGAFLSVAQVSVNADLRLLRDLWADQGRLESMFRKPFRGSPTSLLQGDEYFLPRLRDAFRQLARRWNPRPIDERPVDLTITTSLLTGAQRVTVDSLGQPLKQTTHDETFSFRRGPTARTLVNGQWQTPDDFSAERIEATVDKLALAARSTASFPLAFEPSFIPVVFDGSDTTNGRPNMANAVSWAEADRSGGVRDLSRYTVDGGLLVNTPTQAALEAIDKMPASDSVRRVMLVVHPHAGLPSAARADDPNDPPTVAEAASMILGARSSQSNKSFVDEVERYSREATARRGGLRDVLVNLARAGSTPMPERLFDLAEPLQPHYRELRIREEASEIADRTPSQPGWPWDRVREAAEQAQRSYAVAALPPGIPVRGELPYAPSHWTWRTALDWSTLTPGAHAPTADSETWKDGTSWGWGLPILDQLSDALLDVIALVFRVASPEVMAEVYEKALRKRLHEIRGKLADLHAEIDTAVFTPGAEEPSAEHWRERLEEYATQLVGTSSTLGARTLEQARDLARLALETCPYLRDPMGATPSEARTMQAWCDLLDSDALPGEPADAVTRTLGRLIALMVCATCIAEPPQTRGGPVQLVQLSLHTPNAFVEHSTEPDDKVGGASVHRFGGFLKESWRINDWTWGRLDAATALARTVADPRRLRRLALLRGERSAALVSEDFASLTANLFGVTADEQLPEVVRECGARALAELHALSERDPSEEDGRYLPWLAEYVAWALHIEIVLEELPALARAIHADRAEGANRRSRGQLFLDSEAVLLGQVSRLNHATAASERLSLGVQALRAFDRAGIGREDLSIERGSDQMIRTAATAAAVGVTLLDSDKVGIPAVKAVTRSVRGASLLPYWMVFGLTLSGSAARFVALLVLAFGGISLSVALVAGAPGWVTALGVAALLTTFGFAALRTGTLLHGLVLLAPVLPLTVYAGFRWADDDTGNAAGIVIGAALVVVGFVVLGMLGVPSRTPPAVMSDLTAKLVTRLGFQPPVSFTRTRLGLTAAAVVVLCALVAVIAWLITRYDEDIAAQFVEWWNALGSASGRSIGLVLLVLLGIAVALGGLAASSGSRSLQRWQVSLTGIAPRFRRQRTSHPAALTSSWGWLYGVVFAVIAVAIAFGGVSQPWARLVVFTATPFALVLLAIVTWWPTMRARKDIEARLKPYLVALKNADGRVSESDVALRLAEDELAYSFLVRVDNPDTATERIALTYRGSTMAGTTPRPI